MAEIAVAPRVMKNAVLTLGTDDFAAACSSATVTPSSSVTTWKGLKPTAVFSVGAAATWTLDLEFAQDWDSANSLSQYLFAHEGETIAATLETEDGQETWAMQVIATPGAIGGSVDTVATATVSLGVQGRPVFTAPA